MNCSAISQGYAAVNRTAACLHQSGRLPFTGVDLALMVAGALLLIALGWALRGVRKRENG